MIDSLVVPAGWHPFR